MANNIPVWNVIAGEMLARFSVQSPFIITSYRGYEETFMNKSWMPGDSIRVKFRTRSFPIQGRVASPHDINTQTANIVISEEWNDSKLYTSKEATLALDRNPEEFAEEYIYPMGEGIVVQAESYLGNAAILQANYTIGDATSDFTKTSLSEVRRFMAEHAINMKQGAYAALSPKDANTLRDSLLNQFNPVLNDEIDIHGTLGSYYGYDIFETQLVSQHTNGSFPGAPVTSAVVLSGNLISASGFTGSQLGVLKAGDKITIAGVRSINPRSYNPTSYLMRFTVTQDVDSDAGGNASIPIYPSIISAAGDTNRNVSNSVPSAAVINLIGGANTTYNNNIMYVPRSLSFVMPETSPLQLPYFGQYTDSETGVSIAVGADGDLYNHVNLAKVYAIWGGLWHWPYTVNYITKAELT